MTDKKYNGWSNYETWLMNLWHGDLFLEVAQERWDIDQERPKPEYLEAMIEDLYAEQMPKTGFVADMVNSGMKAVDWRRTCWNRSRRP